MSLLPETTAATLVAPRASRSTPLVAPRAWAGYRAGRKSDDRRDRDRPIANPAATAASVATDVAIQSRRDDSRSECSRSIADFSRIVASRISIVREWRCAALVRWPGVNAT